jgi:hypothetical protein
MITLTMIALAFFAPSAVLVVLSLYAFRGRLENTPTKKNKIWGVVAALLCYLLLGQLGALAALLLLGIFVIPQTTKKLTSKMEQFFNRKSSRNLGWTMIFILFPAKLALGFILGIAGLFTSGGEIPALFGIFSLVISGVIILVTYYRKS